MIIEQIKDLRLEMRDQVYVNNLNQLNTKIFLEQEYEDMQKRMDAELLAQAA